MPQITVMPAVRSKAEQIWDGKQLEKRKIASPQKSSVWDSDLLCKNMKQRGSRLNNMKPLKHYTDAPLYEAFLPFLMCMKLFGLYHNKEYVIRKVENVPYSDGYDNENGMDENANAKPPLAKRITISSVYSVLVTLMLWVNVGRYVTAFSQEDGGFTAMLFQKVIMLMYFFLTAVNALVCFRACHKYTNIPEFFYEWARLHQDYPGECDPHFQRRFANQMKAVLTYYGWSLVGKTKVLKFQPRTDRSLVGKL